MTVGAHCGAHEIMLRESNGISINNLPDSRWFMRSLLLIADKFGDLNLQEPESHKVDG
jgi:hypothetical protein